MLELHHLTVTVVTVTVMGCSSAEDGLPAFLRFHTAARFHGCLLGWVRGLRGQLGAAKGR